MRERPIIFNADMVRAVLDGRKTQTRRIVNWRGISEGLNLQFSGLRASEVPKGWVIESQSRTSSEWRCQPTPCPFGAVGDRLWVRETWSDVYLEDSAAIAYRADGGLRGLTDDDGDEDDPRLEKYSFANWYPDLISGAEGIWRPSIHMPRWASRITLEITGVRVERLRDLSEQDAKSEGVMPPAGGVLPGWEHRINFRDLWMSIYGADNWEANPWVWVIEFKRVEVE